MLNTLQKIGNFQDSDKTSAKLQLLKQSVYPPKRKSPVKSYSVKILPSRKIITKINLVNVQNLLSDEKETNRIQLTRKNSQNSLKKTNINFRQKSDNLQSSLEKISPWTTQNWMPAKSNTSLLRKKYFKEKEEHNIIQTVFQNKVQAIQKKYSPIKDAQSLLRKNSLFLLNFIKTKQRKSTMVPSIDNFPLMMQKVEKKKIPYDQIKTDRQQRQRKFLQNLKTWREQKSIQRTQTNQPALHPQPW